jgi:hypothetical protein
VLNDMFNLVNRDFLQWEGHLVRVEWFLRPVRLVEMEKDEKMWLFVCPFLPM